MTRISVLIADDHAIVREGLCALISKQNDFVVVGQACGGVEALDLAGRLEPDVVVLDVSMPDMNGIEVARRLGMQHPSIRCLALSAHTDRRFVAEMLRAGARGYLAKECAFAELATAVRAVAEGKVYISPGVAADLVEDYVGSLPERLPRLHDALSDREREALIHLAEGDSIKEAAFAMGVSSKTLDTFRRRILTKLGLTSAADLTRYAIREGLIEA